MRLPITAIIFITAVWVFAAMPAHAQRQSLADRVASLEQLAASDRGNAELLNQVSQLRTEMQQLRNTLEQLQNENEQLKQRNRDQYLDLDGRLNRLDRGGTASPAPASPNSPAPAAAGVVAPSAERAPSVHGDRGAMARSGDERTSYDVAFNALKAGNYADSTQLFLSFLELYPNGSYTPNALYWLGESYYAAGQFALAAGQFQGLLQRYPTHDKASGALLKLGLSEYGLGKVDSAETILTDVIARYPGSDVARTADDRLRSIQLGRSIR